MSDLTRMTTEPPVRIVRVTWRTAVFAVLGVIGLVFARDAFIAAHRVLAWTVASIAVAVLIEPVVTWLGRWIPRVLAVILTFLVVGGAVGAVVFGTFQDLDREVRRLRRVAPDAAERLESRDDELGSIATEIDLSARADTFLDALDDRVGSGSGALAENAPTAPVYFVCAILTIFLLVYGPRMATGVAGQIRDADRRATVAGVLSAAVRRARRTVWALLGQGMVIGVVTYGLSTWLSLPAPIVLGLIAGTVAMLPDVGILLGTFPMVALTAALDQLSTAAVLLAGALVVQLLEAFQLRRRIMSFGVDIGPAVVWIVALVGYTVYGPGMAVYGVAYAIFVLAVVDQWAAVRAREADRDDAAEAGSALPGGAGEEDLLGGRGL